MRSLRGIAVAVLVVGLVVGCSDDAEPKAKPSATPSASHSASPSPTAPTMPAAARSKEQSGAVAYAFHFIQTVNHTTATGDTQSLKRLYTGSCEACESLRAEIMEIYDAGGSVEGGDLEIDTYSSIRADRRTWTVGLQAENGRQTIVYSAGAKETERTGAKYSITMDVTRRTDSWTVTRMLVEEQ